MKETFFHVPSRAIINLIPLAHSGDRLDFWVARVSTPPASRGRGIATRLMRELCDECDKHGADLYLGISPSGGLDLMQLHKWYEKFDFVQDPRHPNHLEAMYRPAKSLATGAVI